MKGRGMSTPAYPWYQLVSGDDIEQGDILDTCPVFLLPEDLAGHPFTTATFYWEERDVIVMSQSCDMVKGRRHEAQEGSKGNLWNT
jgi:hypothetical protein